LLQIAYWWFQ